MATEATIATTAEIIITVAHSARLNKQIKCLWR